MKNFIRQNRKLGVEFQVGSLIQKLEELNSQLSGANFKSGKMITKWIKEIKQEENILDKKIRRIS